MLFRMEKKFPEKRELSQKWLNNIGTGHTVDKFTFGKHKVVCEDHFRPECFEEDLRARLMGEKPRKILKSDAVPEIFVHRRPKEGTARSERLLKRSLKKDVASLLEPPQEWFASTSSGSALVSPPVKKKPIHQTVASTQMTPDVASSLEPPEAWFASTSTAASELTPSRKKAIHQTVLSREMISSLDTDQMCDAQTQTEIGCSDAECQTTGPDVIVNTTAIERDHTYARKPAQVSPVGTVVPSGPIAGEQPQQLQSYSKSPPSETEPESSFPSPSSDHETGEIDDTSNDPTYIPEEDDDQDTPDEYPEEKPFRNRTVEECKYLVFSSCLDKLMYKIKCDECYCNVENISRGVVGTGLFVTLTCISGHEVMKWASQPLEGRMPVGNLLTAASIMYSGLTYQRMTSFANLLNLKLFSPTVFYNIQRDYLIPEINSTWLKEQSSLISSLQGKPISIVGDGRCDSPGYSAKYCSYTLMDIETEKVVDFELIQVSETGFSVKMEAVGFNRCFSRVLNDHKLNVDKFASDRHVSIRKLMKDNYKEVKHNFDVFHLAKNISSKLRKIAKKKDNEEIECWIKSINNHIWWCSRNCGKDPSMLIEMWMSLTHHITGKHSWHDDNRFTLFKECRHSAIDPSTNRRKKWLVEGSSAHPALIKIVLNKRLLNDMKYLAEFMHTGALEVFHNVVLKYAPKRLDFDFPYMSARLKLASLDHNHNVGRAQAVVQQPRTGSSRKGELQYKKSFSKIQKQWVLKPIYEKKNYDYVLNMMAGVVKRKHDKQIDTIEHAPAQNIAPVHAPMKEEMLAKHSSRF